MSNHPLPGAGGSYIRDPETGALTLVPPEPVAEPQIAVAAEPAAPSPAPIPAPSRARKPA